MSSLKSCVPPGFVTYDLADWTALAAPAALVKATLVFYSKDDAEDILCT